jgi:hypothetical protein
MSADDASFATPPEGGAVGDGEGRGGAGERASGVVRIVVRPAEPDFVRILQEAQFLLLKYPAAAQAGFQALVEEGRRFAETEEGRRWQRRLAGSELVRRGHMLWEGSAADMLEADPTSILPTALLDAIAAAVSRSDLSDLLDQITPDAILDPRDEADHPPR